MRMGQRSVRVLHRPPSPHPLQMPLQAKCPQGQVGISRTSQRLAWGLYEMPCRKGGGGGGGFKAGGRGLLHVLHAHHIILTQ